MYGAKHELLMSRTKDTDPIIRSSKKNAAVTADVTKPGKVNLTNLRWRMPVLKLPTKYSFEMVADFKAEKILLVETPRGAVRRFPRSGFNSA